MDELENHGEQGAEPRYNMMEASTIPEPEEQGGGEAEIAVEQGHVEEEQRSGVGSTLKGFIFGQKEEEKKVMAEEHPPAAQSDQQEQGGLYVPNFADIHLGGDNAELEAARAEIEAEEIREGSEASTHIDIVQHLPTLPQLFVLIALTEFVINFFRFIAICTEDHGIAFLAARESWFQVTSWIIFLLMCVVCFIYMFFVKNCVRAAGASTLLFFITYVALFEAPLTTSHSSRGFQGTFTFFRGILILAVTGMYALAYRQEIVPPRDHLPAAARNFVVKNKLDAP